MNSQIISEEVVFDLVAACKFIDDVFSYGCFIVFFVQKEDAMMNIQARLCSMTYKLLIIFFSDLSM